jgi:hypothetical protein
MLWVAGMHLSMLMVFMFLVGSYITILLYDVIKTFPVDDVIYGLNYKFFDKFGIKVYYYAEKHFDIDQEKAEQWLTDKKIRFYWTRNTTYEETIRFDSSNDLEEQFIYVYYFLRKRDAMMFKLVWGER